MSKIDFLRRGDIIDNFKNGIIKLTRKETLNLLTMLRIVRMRSDAL